MALENHHISMSKILDVNWIVDRGTFYQILMTSSFLHATMIMIKKTANASKVTGNYPRSIPSLLALGPLLKYKVM